jgi:predicted site-specific integrase-resolvase
MKDNIKGRGATRYLSARRIADHYGVSLRTVDRWIQQGVLPQPEYINGRRYLDLEEAERLRADRLPPARELADGARP